MAEIQSRLRKLARAAASKPARRAFMTKRVLPSYELIELIPHMGHVRTILDVGANRGQFALLALEYWPEAVIHSFEPLSHPASIFEAVHGHQRNVILHRVALGDASASQWMHVSARDDSSSLLPIGKAQNRVFRGTHEVGVVQIEVRRIDDVLDIAVLEHPVLLKLDVQGFEHRLLETFDRTFLARVDIILCELSYLELYEDQHLAHETISLLSALGFSLVAAGTPARHPDYGAVQCDFVFRRVGT